MTGTVQDIWRAIAFELKKLMIQLGVGIPLLLLNFFPGFGTVAFTMGGIALTATMACLDFIDSPLERRRLKFREKLKMIRLALPASASFALVCLGLITVPFIENVNKFQNPFRRPIASLVFIIGFITAVWLGIGACLPIDKAVSLGFW